MRYWVLGLTLAKERIRNDICKRPSPLGSSLAPTQYIPSTVVMLTSNYIVEFLPGKNCELSRIAMLGRSAIPCKLFQKFGKQTSPSSGVSREFP